MRKNQKMLQSNFKREDQTFSELVFLHNLLMDHKIYPHLDLDLDHIPTTLNLGHMAMVLEMILIQFQHQWQHHWHIHINGLGHHHLKDYPDLMVDHQILIDHQIHQCQDLQQHQGHPYLQVYKHQKVLI